MTFDVRGYMDTVLRRIDQGRFGRRDAPQVKLSDDTYLDANNALNGALEVRIRTRSGDMPLIQCDRFSDLKSQDDVDNLLARTLSVLLMNHSEWPR